MAEHPIQGLMGVTMDKVREMVDSNTVVGDPIQAGEGITIIPVSRVTFGLATGGSDVGAKASKEMFGGGSGAGVSVTPIAFLVVKDGDVRTVQIAPYYDSLDRAVGMLPELVDKLSALLKKKTAEKTAEGKPQEQPQTKAE